MTNAVIDGVVDGIVVGAGSSAALQPTSGQGAIPVALLSQFLLSITVSWAALKKARLCRGGGGLRGREKEGGRWQRLGLPPLAPTQLCPYLTLLSLSGPAPTLSPKYWDWFPLLFRMVPQCPWAPLTHSPCPKSTHSCFPALACWLFQFSWTHNAGWGSIMFQSFIHVVKVSFCRRKSNPCHQVLYSQKVSTQAGTKDSLFHARKVVSAECFLCNLKRVSMVPSHKQRQEKRHTI